MRALCPASILLRSASPKPDRDTSQANTARRRVRFIRLSNGTASQVRLCALCLALLSFRSQGEYYNCAPQIFLKFSRLQDIGMDRYSSPKFSVEMDFYYFKNSVQFETRFSFFRYNTTVPSRTPSSST